jgi:energy-coupling factor transporter transmembrane protein EcfT
MSVFTRTPRWIYYVGLGLSMLAIWLLIGTTGENVLGMLTLLAALTCWTVGSALIGKRRWVNRVPAVLLGVIVGVFLLWWTSISRPVAILVLSESRRCTMHFHQWSTGNCVLSCEENGARIGKAKLSTGLFTHPWAVFPGPAGKSVVCFSWLDTTYAVFAFDLTNSNSQGVDVPEKLRNVVDHSTFKVRACTKGEVAFVADFIRTNNSTLSGLSRWGLTSQESRDNALLFLKLATTRNDWKDQVLKDAWPQILPEDE